MTLIIDCPSCTRKLRVPEDLLGTHVKCPSCLTTFTAHETTAVPEAAARDTAAQEFERGDWADAEDTSPPRPRSWTEPHRGPLVLTLGILSLILIVTVLGSPIGLGLGLAAWIMGQNDLQRVQLKEMDPSGADLTQAGWICGILGTILNGLICLCCLGLAGVVSVR